MDDNKFQKNIYFLLLFFAAILTGLLLKTLSSVILPVIFAALLSFVFMPVVHKLNTKFRLPWQLSSFLITILVLVIILLTSSILATSLGTILDEIPKYENRFLAIYKFFAEKLNLEFDEGKGFIENMWNQMKVREYVQKAALGLSSGLFTFGKNIFIVILYFVLLLLEMRFTTSKINYAFVGKTKGKVIRISKTIAKDVVRFISIKFFISLATGLLIFAGCLVLKIDFAIVWGFLSFVMNFIPTFGSIFATLIISLFALLQFYPVFTKPVIILLYVILVNFVLGNIVEPKVEGEHLGLSTFVILVSLALWGYIWGFTGMILAVPMTVIIKICCENISYLHPIAIILGGDPERRKTVAAVEETDISEEIKDENNHFQKGASEAKTEVNTPEQAARQELALKNEDMNAEI